MHTCSSNTCAVIGMADTHVVEAYCYVEGQVLTNAWGQTHDERALVYDTQTGRAGWTNVGWLAALHYSLPAAEPRLRAPRRRGPRFAAGSGRLTRQPAGGRHAVTAARSGLA